MMKKARLFQVAVLMVTLLFASLQGHAQNVSVRGTVSDDSGAPLVGVNVYVDGTAIGTATGADGSYQLSVAPNAEITYQYVGYDNQVIPVAGRTVINVTLTSSSLMIDDVVVIGYGVTTKRDLTGSVTQVKAEDLMATAPTSIQEALRGKAAGVVVTGGGMNPQIRIRGNRSISANNDPLFVIDGIPQVGGLDLINPNDVESMEILKDASATAIYGSRGANGVILVTTKQGEKGRVTVTYDGYLNIEELNRWRPLQNAGEYLEYLRESMRSYDYDGNGGYSLDASTNYPTEEPNMEADLTLPDISGDPYSVESVRQGWEGGVYDPSKLRFFDWEQSNWRKQWFSHSHNLSIRGGSENTLVAISGNFMDNQGQTNDSYRTRYMLNMNIEQKVNKAITVGARASFSYMQWENGFGISGVFSPLRNPYNPPMKEDGSYDYTKLGDPANGIIVQPDPLSYNSYLNKDGHERIWKNNRASTALYARINLLPELTYYANFGTNLRYSQEQRFDGKYSTEAALGDPRAYSYADNNRDWNFTQTLTYAKTIGDHNFSVMVAQDAFKDVFERLRGTGMELPLESQMWNALGDAAVQSVSTDFSQRTLLSFFGRAHYGYKGKYLLDVTYRHDGASVLAEGNKWAGFPSAALAWRISDEPFMKNQNIFSNLKLRVGYGESGQQSVNPYSSVGQIRAMRYTWGTAGTVGYIPNSLSNSALTWERSATLSVGIDFAVLRGRLSGVIDLYRTNTTDLLMTRTLPQASGFGSILQNIGASRNQGIEVGLSSINVQNRHISWTTDLTFAFNKEEIVKLNSGLSEDIANRWFVGSPIHTYYDIQGDGIWGYSAAEMAERAKFATVNPVGQYRYVDQDGNYSIDDLDRIKIGQKMPKVTGSLSNTFRYTFNNGSSLDLFVFIYGGAGFTVYRHPDSGGAMGRYNKTAVDYWTPRNPGSGLNVKPETTLDPANITYRSAMGYFKGDYWKIDDITVGYRLAPSMLKNLGINNVRIYAKVRNPFKAFTKYPYNDPEGAANLPASGAWYNSEYGDGNTIRTYQFGLQLSF